MCSYNPNLNFLRESIQSVLDQSYKFLEIIFVNDGSTIDGLEDFIKSFNDNRIVFVNNTENKGLTKCLNQGLKYCHGDFIARMDDDDICMPLRIETQVNLMCEDDKINVLGTDTEVFGNESRYSHYVLADTREEQQVELFFKNVGLAHPTVMFRTDFLKKNNLSYDERYEKAQDYGLWVDCTYYDRLYCIDKVLLKYRTHSKQASQSSRDKQICAEKKIRINQLCRLGVNPTEKEVEMHQNLCNGNMIAMVNDFDAFAKWIKKLVKNNKKTNYLDRKAFKRKLKKYFFLVCINYIKTQNIIKFAELFIKNINTFILIA